MLNEAVNLSAAEQYFAAGPSQELQLTYRGVHEELFQAKVPLLLLQSDLVSIQAQHS